MWSLGLTERPRLSLPVIGSRTGGWWLLERLDFLLSARADSEVLDSLHLRGHQKRHPETYQVHVYYTMFWKDNYHSLTVGWQYR